MTRWTPFVTGARSLFLGLEIFLSLFSGLLGSSPFCSLTWNPFATLELKIFLGDSPGVVIMNSCTESDIVI